MPIDFASVNEKAGDLRELIARDLNHCGRSDKFLCPFHDGGRERTPSLHVYEDHYHCFACNAHGDAVSWVALRNRISMVEAARRIAPTLPTRQERQGRPDRRRTTDLTMESPSPLSGASRAIPGASPHVAPPEIWRHPNYQSKLDAIVSMGEEILWSNEGRSPLDWLRRRGLTEETIFRFRIGFFPSPHFTASPVPGLFDRLDRPAKLRVVRGITIPWAAPGNWYNERDDLEVGPDCRPLLVQAAGPRWVGMNVRQLADDVDAPLPSGMDKCKAIRGSRRGYLYPWPDILPSQGNLPILLVEGEFDALIGQQHAGHILHVGTVGSASTSPMNLPVETRAAIARCTWLLLALDCDEAGAEAARTWRAAYPHKSRRVLLPSGKDLNDFLAAGGDLYRWLAEIRDGCERAAARSGRTSSARI